MTKWRPAQEGDPSWDPRLFNTGEETVHWSGHWDWSGDWDKRLKPDFLPDQMARMGVFGDSYWGGAGGQHRLLMLTEQLRAGRDTFTKTGQHYTNQRGKQCKEVNFFGRPASLSRDWWLDRHMIHVADPLGWYEWFWWYAMVGRRMPIYDDWQIRRWVDYRKRQRAMYFARPSAGTGQALLHWGIRASGELIP